MCMEDLIRAKRLKEEVENLSCMQCDTKLVFKCLTLDEEYNFDGKVIALTEIYCKVCEGIDITNFNFDHP